MTYDAEEFIKGFVAGGCVAILIFTFTFWLTKDNYKSNKQIIEHNCGYYDPKTKEFKWGELK